MNESDKIALEIIKELLLNRDSYVDPNFGENKFYIDGCTQYKSEEDKEFIINWLKDLGVKIWNSKK